MTRARSTAGPGAPFKRARHRSQTGIGQGGVSVAGQGTPFNPFVVTFTGALAATSVSLTANYSGISTGSGSQPGTTTQTSWGGPGTDEQEVVGYAATGDNAVTGGEFDLTFNAQTTAVAYDATPAQVKSALGNMGLTNIEVTGPSGSGIGATGAAIFTITFVGALGGQYLAQPVGISDDATSPLTDSQGSTADIALESAITLGGADEVDDVQQVIVTQTSGTFALGYGGNSTPAQTVGETAAKLQTALEGLPGLAQATVTGSGTAASPYLVTFGGDLKGENVPLLGGGNAVNTIAMAYNADGSINSIGDNYSHYAYTYDGEGNTATVDNGGTPNVPDVVLASSFDAAGNRASLAATIGGTKDFVNTYEYDALSRVTQIEQTGVTNGNTVAYKELDYTFDPLGDVTSRAAYSEPNTPRSDVATGKYEYNSLGQLTSLGYTSNAGTTAIDDFTWGFDSLGRVSTFSSIDGTATYGYDSVNEVTTASYSTNSGGHQPQNESYNFDANGNRPAENGSTTINNEVSDDGTYHYTFDASGNRLTETPDTGAPSSDHPASFSYDYRNRLVEVQEFNNATPPTLTEQINYKYDVFDHLIERDDDVIDGSTTTTHYVWDQFSPLPSGEGQGGGGIVLAFNGNKQLTARYVNGPNTSAYDQFFTTLAEEDVSAGKVNFDLVDQLGTVRDIVDQNGNLLDHLNYNSYGLQVYASAPSVTHIDGFAGGLYDPSTGLVYFINRWYDPTATVWIQADPKGFTAGDSNLTRYVENDPTNGTDPTGLSKGGKQRIQVSGVPSNVTLDELERIIAEAEASGASAAHLKKLRALKKVLRRNVRFRGGCADLRVVVGKAGTVIAVAEVTSIVNHGSDRIELEKISEETLPDSSVTAIYFGRELEATGFLGFGAEKQTGSVLYVLTVPESRVKRDGLPPDKLNPRLYNLRADCDILQEMGIKEEYLSLPDNIRTANDLLSKDQQTPAPKEK